MRGSLHAPVKLTRRDSEGRRPEGPLPFFAAAVLIAALLTLACSGNSATSDPPAPALEIVAPILDSPIVDRMPPTEARPLDPVKLAVFDRINRDRAAEGVGPVLWDDGASRVADEYCRNQIRERTSGHFLTDGVPPYARTSFAGIFGMQYENAVTWRTTASGFEEGVLSLALHSHAEMLAEQPPNDGHRKTILDPAATHVGVGYAIVGGSFRMAQEFLTRHLEFLRVERLPSRPVVLFYGAPVTGRILQFVTIGWEPPPARLTREEASSRTSYSYPPPVFAFVEEGNLTLKVAGTVTSDRIRWTGPREFTFRFTPDRPGLWTVEFYTAAPKDPRPVQGGAATIWFDVPAPPPVPEETP